MKRMIVLVFILVLTGCTDVDKVPVNDVGFQPQEIFVEVQEVPDTQSDIYVPDVTYHEKVMHDVLWNCSSIGFCYYDLDGSTTLSYSELDDSYLIVLPGDQNNSTCEKEVLLVYKSGDYFYKNCINYISEEPVEIGLDRIIIGEREIMLLENQLTLLTQVQELLKMQK